jgi:hypothetical protein
MGYRIAALVFRLYLAVAIVYLGVGAGVLFGIFGMRPDPETALPILFIGAPWSFLSLAALTGKEAPAVIFLLLGVIPLGLNTLLLWLLQRWLGKRAARLAH